MFKKKKYKENTEKEIKSKDSIEEEPISKVQSEGKPTSSKLEDLIEKNIKWSQAIFEQNKKIKRRLTMMVLGSYLRLLIVVVPIILAIIYLPPLFKGLLDQYSQIFGAVGGGSSQINDILSQISGGQLEEVLKMLGTK